ncbi:MAG: lysophospholipid acyltransferase family protein [Gemmobacter sp.]
MSDRQGFRPDHWVQNLLLRGLIGGLLLLPYRLRVPLCGKLMAFVIAPVAGWRRRIRDNLALVRPDLPAAEVRRLMRAVPDNMGRSVIEAYSGPEFLARARGWEPRGPGIAALEAAHAENRPVIFVTAHFGNYDAARAVLRARGHQVGGLYKPMTNRYFNAHYVRAMAAIGEPVFPRGRRGLAGMVRFLREGGKLGMLIDQHQYRGAPLTFFGHEAMTALSAAEMALKYGALLIPAYGIRQPDGLGFEVIFEAPIKPASPEAMTQALNDSLEARVREHMDQWFWIHRRWRGRGPQRDGAAPAP